MERDPFYNYKVQFESAEREFLNEEEVKALVEKDLHFDRLKLVRDMFVFSCYTGLAYSDVKICAKQISPQELMVVNTICIGYYWLSD